MTIFSHRRFDFEVSREYEPRKLRWRDAGDFDGDYWNRSYSDLSGFSGDEVQRVIQLETELVRRIELSEDPEAELLAIDDELYESFDADLYGLDLGVASTVAALSGAGCIPISSCNGGAFGDRHREEYPLVAMFASPDALPGIKAAAEAADVGLENSADGVLVVYANDIRRMMRFASHLLEAST